MTTKKFTLRTAHTEWLLLTGQFYNEILYFYYQLFLGHEELHRMGNQKAMRSLERLSIVGKAGEAVECPLPWKGVPLYFRRAAINTAMAAGKSYLARKEQAHPSKAFSAGITLYKGMYRELDNHSVEMKVWNGEKWKWIRCRLFGSEIPEGAVCLSPKVVFREKRMELHIPIRQEVPGKGILKQRMNEHMRICCVQFTSGDAAAVCCVLNSRCDVEAVKFLHGGRAYVNRCQEVFNKIEKSKKSVGNKSDSQANKKYWKKLKYINEDMSHQISRKIVNFGREHGAEVIVLSKYESEYCNGMEVTGKWPLLQLNYCVRTQLKYKAWQDGIFILETPAADIGKNCALCGAAVHKDGEQFVCNNGHKGNRWLNSARNLGKRTYKSLNKRI